MKENQRITVTKRMLKEGLVRLLQTKELDQIKVTELCQESGVNRATFYRHYETPKDVLAELNLDFIRQMMPDVRHATTAAEEHAFLENAFSYLYDHRDLAKVLLRCSSGMEMAKRLDDFLSDRWEQVKSAQKIEGVDEDTARIIRTMLGGGCFCLLRQWILEDIPKTPQEIATIVSGIIRLPIRNPMEPSTDPAD